VQSNRVTSLVQGLVFVSGIAWAFAISKQTLSQTQVPGFLIALAISWWLTPEIRARALALKLVDKPGQETGDERHHHKVATPRLGGVAIYIGVLSAITLLVAICGRLPMIARQGEGAFIGIAVGGTVVFVLGLVDDLGSINAKMKLLVQLIAGCAAYSMGVRISAIPVPDNVQMLLHLPALIQLGWLSVPLTVLWLVGIANAVNLIDGMDGLATGVSAISALTIWSVAVSPQIHRHYAALVAAVLAGALIGFLRWNFNPARIFIGDSGAYLTGFILAAISITGVIKGATTATLIVPTFLIALLILFFPLLDTSWAIIRRVAQGRSIFSPDAGHIHHRLLERVKSQKKVAYLIYGLTAVLGFFAAAIVHQGTYYVTLCSAVLGMAVFFALVLNRHHQKGARTEGEQAVDPDGDGGKKDVILEPQPPAKELESQVDEVVEATIGGGEVKQALEESLNKNDGTKQS